jgi:hypothetical protein
MIAGIKPIWWWALAAIVGLSAWSIWQSDEVDPGVARAQERARAPLRTAAGPHSSAPPAASGDAWSKALRRSMPIAAVGDPFQSESLRQQASGPAAPAAAPVTRTLPRPAVIAPALPPTVPYTYLGKLERDGKLEVYLDNSGSALVARAGQTLPGGWRFEGIDGGMLSFTYLASNEKQTLSLRVNP